MIFNWKKNRKQIKSSNFFAFELWTVRQFQRLASFSKWTVSVLLASLCHWYSCFCLFIMVTFWHHYDTYSCCSICLQKPVRGDWVGWWTVLRPYSLEGRPVQSCVRSDLYLQAAPAIFFFITETVLSCALCVSSNFLSSFVLCKKWFKSRFSSAFAFARTVSVWAFSRRFCLMDGNVPKGFERCWKKFLALRGLLAWALFFLVPELPEVLKNV